MPCRAYNQMLQIHWQGTACCLKTEVTSPAIREHDAHVLMRSQGLDQQRCPHEQLTISTLLNTLPSQVHGVWVEHPLEIEEKRPRLAKLEFTRQL